VPNSSTQHHLPIQPTAPGGLDHGPGIGFAHRFGFGLLSAQQAGLFCVLPDFALQPCVYSVLMYPDMTPGSNINMLKTIFIGMPTIVEIDLRLPQKALQAIL
jgi:hypothetical protein